MIQITLQEQFELKNCPVCGIAYALPTAFVLDRRRNGNNFYCPNGHGLNFGEKEADRLRKELEKTSKISAAEYSMRLQAEERAARLVSANKKLEKRLSAGVCPVPGCRRHFSDLQRHINTVHHGSVITAPESTQKLIEGKVQ
jgi:hypothetical protein